MANKMTHCLRYNQNGTAVIFVNTINNLNLSRHSNVFEKQTKENTGFTSLLCFQFNQAVIPP